MASFCTHYYFCHHCVYIVWTCDKNIYTLASVEVTETPEGLYMSAILSLFQYGLITSMWDPRVHPLVTLIEEFLCDRRQENGMQFRALSSIKDESMSSQVDFWKILLLEPCYIRAVKLFHTKSSNPDLLASLCFFHSFAYTAPSVRCPLLRLPYLRSFILWLISHVIFVHVLPCVQQLLVECLALPVWGKQNNAPPPPKMSTSYSVEVVTMLCYIARGN